MHELMENIILNLAIILVISGTATLWINRKIVKELFKDLFK